MKRIYLVLLFLALLMPASYATERVTHSHSSTIAKESTVYVTRTGKKYHKDGCRHLAKSKIETTKDDALKKGFEACKVCKP